MKKLLLTGCLIWVLESQAQKSIDGLLHAEKNFAAYAVSNGTKDAFLKYLDSNSVVFENMNAVNGLTVWQKREKRPGILNWHPQFAEISLSGDFGYTSGPWTFQRKTTSDSILASGQFNSIWQLNKEGEWKNLLDIGNTMPVDLMAGEQIITAAKVGKRRADEKELRSAEEAFISLAQTDPAAAYRRFLSGVSILNHNGFRPATKAADPEKLITAASSALQYEVKGSGMATSGDLGYVYGNTSLHDKKDNYLRVWRREKNGWKIALEVLHQ
jgi:ketosteroid isomerase-like protein